MWTAFYNRLSYILRATSARKESYFYILNKILVVAISFIISSSFFFKLDISLRNSGLAATFTAVTFLRPCPQVSDGLASENLLMYSNYYF